jgi:hypothetical protein
VEYLAEGQIRFTQNGGTAVITGPLDALKVAKRAVAEGEAIVRQAHEYFGLKERRMAGPMERAWQHGQIGKPPPAQQSLTEQDHQNIDAVRAMLALMRLTKKPALKESAYRDVCIHLQRLKKDRERQEWIAIVQRECNVSWPRDAGLLYLKGLGGPRPDRLAA